ncbi:FG-GAP repeat domain-containing protein [Crocosphaera chwakensis]|uniref:Integrin-like repeats domain fused to lysozyme, LYCV glycosyl hydrolase n=1 Tax=Crocosphaera chwakensis CCY0110 TaxID=391612 RepID=A3IV98_9CHRO|nr:VCBS repeat-containing protein [Crocosphaera chwakensis]EAZ89567.1 Integrin-like repeats domain fused to lysozyme, LYCV glycosyl hydrolase [Crocosphaera chwakensis CCY0110]
MNNYLESGENSSFSPELKQALSSFNDEYNLSAFTHTNQQGANLAEINSLAEKIAFFEQMLGESTNQETKLNQAKDIAQDALTEFASHEGFSDAFTVAFGDSYNQAIADSIAQQWAKDDFGLFPEIEVLSAEDMGDANGAFATSTGKIYVSEDFLLNNSLSDIVSVILEETGHYVDYQINVTDAVGDEGEIFAHLVQGDVLSDGELASLQSENDWGVINIGGVDVLVEQNLDLTALHETGSNFEFEMTDWNRDGRADLVAIKKSSTGTRSTEVHIFSGATNFKSALLNTGTALHETGSNFEFEMTDWNRDGFSDLVAIKKSSTGTRSTEVHIFSGATNFKSALLNTGTALHETGSNFEFEMTDWNRDGFSDLVAIKKSSTGTRSTEVHIFSGATNFKSALLNTGTALHETGSNFEFEMTDWNRDGRADLVAIKKSSTGTRSTEVHIFSGATNFKSALLNTGTALHETGSNFEFEMTDWNRDGRADLVAIKKSSTGTRSTEVHIFSGATNFKSALLHTGTALHETGDRGTPSPTPQPPSLPTPEPSPALMTTSSNLTRLLNGEFDGQYIEADGGYRYQCVDLVKDMTDTEKINTSYWKRGENVIQNRNVAVGSAIAIFDSNGNYNHRHTAIFAGYDTQNGVFGFWAWSQNYPTGSPVTKHFISINGNAASNADADQYYLIKPI